MLPRPTFFLVTHFNPFRNCENSHTRILFVKAEYFGLWGLCNLSFSDKRDASVNMKKYEGQLSAATFMLLVFSIDASLIKHSKSVNVFRLYSVRSAL